MAVSLGVLGLEVEGNVSDAKRELSSFSSTVKKSFSQIPGAASGPSGAIVRLSDNFSGLTGAAGATFTAIGVGTAAMAGLALSAAGLVKAIDLATASFRDFEKAVAEISTLVDTTKTPTKELGDTVKDLAAQFGGNITDQAKSLYQTISSGAAAGADATKILTVANKLAIGGVADITTTLDGLTSVINAYRLSSDDAASVADAFFTSVRDGKTTVEELAGGIGLVASLANNLKVSYDDLLAVTTQITKQGVSQSQAFTQVRSAMVAVTKATDDAKDLARELGIDFSIAAIESKGLAQFLLDVNNAVGGNANALAQLFPRIEGLNAILNATADEKGLLQLLENQRNRTGEADKAFGKLNTTLAQQRNRLKGLAQVVKTEIGQSISELTTFPGVISEINTGLEELAQKFRTASSEAKSVNAEVSSISEAFSTAVNIVRALTDSVLEVTRIMAFGFRTVLSPLYVLVDILDVIGGTISLVGRSIVSVFAGIAAEILETIGVTSDFAKALGLDKALDTLKGIQSSFKVLADESARFLQGEAFGELFSFELLDGLVDIDKAFDRARFWVDPIEETTKAAKGLKKELEGIADVAVDTGVEFGPDPAEFFKIQKSREAQRKLDEIERKKRARDAKDTAKAIQGSLAGFGDLIGEELSSGLSFDLNELLGQDFTLQSSLSIQGQDSAFDVVRGDFAKFVTEAGQRISLLSKEAAFEFQRNFVNNLEADKLKADLEVSAVLDTATLDNARKVFEDLSEELSQVVSIEGDTNNLNRDLGNLARSADILIDGLSSIDASVDPASVKQIQTTLQAIKDRFSEFNIEARVKAVRETGTDESAQTVAVEGIQSAADAAKNLSRSLSEGPGIGKQIQDSLAGFLSGFEGFGRALSAAFSAAGPIGAAIAVFVELARNTESFQKIVAQVNTLFGIAVDAIEPLVEAIQEGLTPVIQALAPVLRSLGEVIGEIAGPIGEIVGRIAQSLAPILRTLSEALSALAPLIGSLVEIAIDLSAPLQAIAPQLELIGAQLKILFEVLKPFIDAVSSIAGLVSKATDVFGALSFGLAGQISIGGDAVVGALRGVGKAISGIFSGGGSDKPESAFAQLTTTQARLTALRDARDLATSEKQISDLNKGIRAQLQKRILILSDLERKTKGEFAKIRTDSGIVKAIGELIEESPDFSSAIRSLENLQQSIQQRTGLLSNEVSVALDSLRDNLLSSLERAGLDAIGSEELSFDQELEAIRDSANQIREAGGSAGRFLSDALDQAAAEVAGSLLDSTEQLDRLAQIVSNAESLGLDGDAIIADDLATVAQNIADQFISESQKVAELLQLRAEAIERGLDVSAIDAELSELGTAADKQTDAANALSRAADSITNVPQGFKVALARFEAADPERFFRESMNSVAAMTRSAPASEPLFGSTTSGLSAAPQAPTIENVYIIADEDPRKTWEKLNQVASFEIHSIYGSGAVASNALLNRSRA